MRPAPRQAGITLIELLIALTISTMTLVLVAYFALDISNFGSVINQRLDTERELELTLRVMLSEVRSMGPGDNGSYDIVTATPTTFTFYSDVDGDGKFEQVRYFLNGTTLEKGVTKSSGANPVVYNASDEKVTDVVHYVRNATLFQYFAEGYAPEIGPLASPVDVSAIRMIQVTGTVDEVPGSPPGPVTLSTMVTIRNLRGEI
ncbi:MAG TPA: type II secretion system protein [Candidatus Paceibacterota bacterium]|nr:type II secretion system protein [Candidatus Paceibacterota bacterium]